MRETVHAYAEIKDLFKTKYEMDIVTEQLESSLHWSYVVNEEDYQLWLTSKKKKAS